ncbi:YcjF family protein [Mangrovibrevibacter kandeliae]|uniref:YcjF family protein n=1 Tax=Mangrovibrevibacter kandeliae TaxID=2968473 RepID=UPI0021195AAA|nr:TIGR01620 family protein [Aurantimonas sp. CSK15Z-1]MCQ8782783.1 TIGR01620 family protein [Aurantimonas sp. CSK15Z-1]
MSDRRERPPLVFRLDQLDPASGRVQADTEERAMPPPARAPRAVQDLSRIAFEPDEAIDDDLLGELADAPARPRRRRFSFLKLFLAALGALLSLAAGLAVDALVRDLFQRADWLGWTALALAGLLLVGALGLVAREATALLRLSAVERERRAAQAAFDADSRTEAEGVVAGLVALLADRPETAEGRARLAALEGEVIDGRDLVALAERELLVPLDERAKALVASSAKRVSVVTAVSPKALVDVSYVLLQTIRLIRQVSELYGARPGTLGLIRLTRDVVAHLAVTGSIAIGDGVVQQLVGHGLASRLSARLGEGVVNGLLTARVGIAAMDLCRPLPFLRIRRPRIGDFATELSPLPRSPDALKERRGTVAPID